MNEVQFLWAIQPADCTWALCKIEKLGLTEKARDFILTEAQASLKRFGDHNSLEICHALELAAEKWLEKEGL